MATALAMKEEVFCSSMMKKLGLGTRFDSVTLYIDNTSATHVAGNRTYSSRVKNVALRYFFIHEHVKEGRINVNYVKTEDQLANIGTKHLSKKKQRYLFKLISEFRAAIEKFRRSNRTGSFFADRLYLLFVAGMRKLHCASYIVLFTLSVF